MVSWGAPPAERADAARNRRHLLVVAREMLAEHGADKKTGIAYLPLVTAAKAGHPLAGTAAQVKAAIYDHALSVGFGRGFEVSAGIMLIALIVTIAAVRVRRADLAGAQAAQASPAGDDASAEMAEAGQSGRAGPRA